MEKKDAVAKIRMLLLKTGSLALTKHARERMAERGFSMHDIICALSGGTMVDGPTASAHCNGFDCTMRIQFSDGRALEVPIIVDEDKMRIIVKSVVRK